MLWLIVLMLLCGVAYLCCKKNRTCLHAVELAGLSNIGGTALSFWYRVFIFGCELCAMLFFSLLVLYCVAGSGPLKSLYETFFDIKSHSTAISRRVFFVVDRSGSMAEPMPTSVGVVKMNVVKAGILEAIAQLDKEGGDNDLLGLATFARAEQIVVPLTKDRRFFSEALSSVVPETIESLNGTAIGYAIFKAATLIIACSDIKAAEKKATASPTFGSTIIVLTDGLEEPNPADELHPYRSMRSLNALRFAKDNHICVQYINVDKTACQRMIPQERDRLVEAVEATGGSYQEAMNQDQVAGILKDVIVQKMPEKVLVESDNNGMVIAFLLAMTILFVCAGRGLETIVLKVSR